MNSVKNQPFLTIFRSVLPVFRKELFSLELASETQLMLTRCGILENEKTIVFSQNKSILETAKFNQSSLFKHFLTDSTQKSPT